MASEDVLSTLHAPQFVQKSICQQGLHPLWNAQNPTDVDLVYPCFRYNPIAGVRTYKNMTYLLYSGVPLPLSQQKLLSPIAASNPTYTPGFDMEMTPFGKQRQVPALTCCILCVKMMIVHA